MKTLVELNSGECKWPVSDDLPSETALCRDLPFAKHLFCGDPTVNPDDPECAYCAAHHALAYGGFGKPWQALEKMMNAVEHEVVRLAHAKNDDRTAPIDNVVRGEAGNSGEQKRASVFRVFYKRYQTGNPKKRIG